MNQQQRLEWSLLSLRLGVFIVMLMWTLDKFVHPAHSAGVFGKFYGLPGLAEWVFYGLGAAELALLLAFLAGLWRRFTYGAVLLLHAVSTLSSWQQYLDPFSNLLFFAAWPMLAACLALYLLRDADRRLTLQR